jgi:predicted O-linked N-acetylglucosamine transferase (SPINDLY family)
MNYRLCTLTHAGILDDLNPALRSKLHLMAMCFPTPRDKTTDRVNALFHEHINLFPRNRTQTLMRIQKSQPDFVLFSDAGCDCRTFTLAHMRLAPFQGALWGWGGTLGIPTIDYYFFPEILWSSSKCYSEYDVPQLPQELYSEQVYLVTLLQFICLSFQNFESSYPYL